MAFADKTTLHLAIYVSEQIVIVNFFSHEIEQLTNFAQSNQCICFLNYDAQ